MFLDLLKKHVAVKLLGLAWGRVEFEYMKQRAPIKSKKKEICNQRKCAIISLEPQNVYVQFFF